MYEEIKDLIVVAAVFKSGHVLPYAFTWNGRKYLVTAVNLQHTEKRGESTILCFSVTSSGNFYELSFDSKEMTWTLEKTWV